MPETLINILAIIGGAAIALLLIGAALVLRAIDRAAAIISRGMGE